MYGVWSNPDSGLDGAEDIADYGLQIASSDGFIGISGLSGRYGVRSSNFQILSKQICVAVLVELGQYTGNKEAVAWGVSFCRDRGFPSRLVLS
ncbi:hypothetical protein ACN42_g8273 [Penicillium freii]|uniref:Uncharacterized protein n=1 Tax=Penicillium freii TaxID=48697 RepID=A0A101MEC1_PENFR|nr:hypothetical protein ACN42_g8273 [Penicillium freii]